MPAAPVGARRPAAGAVGVGAAGAARAAAAGAPPEAREAQRCRARAGRGWRQGWPRRRGAARRRRQPALQAQPARPVRRLRAASRSGLRRARWRAAQAAAAAAAQRRRCPRRAALARSRSTPRSARRSAPLCNHREGMSACSSCCRSRTLATGGGYKGPPDAATHCFESVARLSSKCDDRVTVGWRHRKVVRERRAAPRDRGGGRALGADLKTLRDRLPGGTASPAALRDTRNIKKYSIGRAPCIQHRRAPKSGHAGYRDRLLGASSGLGGDFFRPPSDARVEIASAPCPMQLTVPRARCSKASRAASGVSHPG